jgi:hypothetical protein
MFRKETVVEPHSFVHYFEMNETFDSKSAGTAGSIQEMIDPVLLKLNQFNPGMPYDREHIRSALQRTVRSGRIKGLGLAPDKKRFNSKVGGNDYILLLNLTCKMFVDPVINPRFPTKKRISRQQKDFAFELENEIYYLENSDGAFSGM